MNDKELITRIKIYKAMGFIKNYYELAGIIGLTERSFYNWLGGHYALSYQKKQILNNLMKEHGV
jgi:hypothetical protein